MIGKTSILQIEHAMKLYQAANDRYPKDLQEFMDEIVKANNIRLPTLPHYQEYGYDEKEHKLVILEYPDRKRSEPGGAGLARVPIGPSARIPALKASSSPGGRGSG